MFKLKFEPISCLMYLILYLLLTVLLLKLAPQNCLHLLLAPKTSDYLLRNQNDYANYVLAKSTLENLLCMRPVVDQTIGYMRLN